MSQQLAYMRILPLGIRLFMNEPLMLLLYKYACCAIEACGLKKLKHIIIDERLIYLAIESCKVYLISILQS